MSKLKLLMLAGVSSVVLNFVFNMIFWVLDSTWMNLFLMLFWYVASVCVIKLYVDDKDL